MNNITRYTIAFWVNMIICNLWLIKGDMLIAALFFIGAMISTWQDNKEKDDK